MLFTYSCVQKEIGNNKRKKINTPGFLLKMSPFRRKIFLLLFCDHVAYKIISQIMPEICG